MTVTNSKMHLIKPFRAAALLSVAMLCAPMSAQAEPLDRSFGAPNPNNAYERLIEETTQTKEDKIDHREAARLLGAIDSLLEETAENRRDTRKLPSKKDYIVAVPPWTETREDRHEKIQELLSAALEIIADVPVVKLQGAIKKRRETIADINNQIATLRERKLDAPKDGILPGIISETVDSIEAQIKDLKKRIAANEAEISKTKSQIGQALAAQDIFISEEQLDLLLDSVLGTDLIKLVAVFNAAKQIDARLGVLMRENSESLTAARRYFAMHAALFAMLLHSQDELLRKIDKVYLKRLSGIKNDIRQARRTTYDLMRQNNRPDQSRALQANRKAQEFAEEVADFYRDYLKTQREQILAARRRTYKDLRIADNTYETVEASFQLNALMEDARASFDAIKGLEAPGFEQLFQNEQLKKEFENLTRKLDIPSS